ncbi:rhodanese-like domain-containing protein [Sphingobacterium lactis]|uniref:Rhodanese-related sulfurtransferase n=1 Tax=Sphingobacterium lactis TaxID=797291 RepID=A0A1H5ZUQ9_9SPHI|nr:rhodanese-like domain-containing protein [Sphingobacterium lactis]SEG39714.1 Rhodanese-related sulfurtransferase [Sphingobacterium lactis]
MKEISVQELKDMMDHNTEFQLIDVREPFEYEVSNLNGVNIPLSGVVIESDKISKDLPVVIHCRSGKRSAQAIMLLEQEGFTNLSNLQGGILAWKEAFDPEMDVY